MKKYNRKYRLGFIKNGLNGRDKYNCKLYSLHNLDNEKSLFKGYYNMDMQIGHWFTYNNKNYNYYL